MRAPSTTVRHALAALVVAWGAGSAESASFGVSPVRAELDSRRPIASFVLRNRAATETVVQVDVAAWRQRDGTDVLEPTDALIATPPIATIPAGGQQVVRVGLRREADRDATEQAYRLLLEEIPTTTAADFQGMRVTLRMSLPVFVRPAGGGRAALRWQAELSTSGELVVSATNAGNTHAQVATLEVYGGEGAAVTSSPLAGYVLAGQRREWRMPLATRPASLRLRGRTTTGAIDETIAIGSE
jgi:fimbrial chaperone protein